MVGIIGVVFFLLVVMAIRFVVVAVGEDKKRWYVFFINYHKIPYTIQRCKKRLFTKDVGGVSDGNR